MVYSNRFDVSLQEKELVEWIRKKMQNGDIVPSLIFRDAMLEKKKEEDVMKADNPVLLKQRISSLQKTIRAFTDFIEKNNLNESWCYFFENYQEEKIVEVVNDSTNLS